VSGVVPERFGMTADSSSAATTPARKVRRPGNRRWAEIIAVLTLIIGGLFVLDSLDGWQWTLLAVMASAGLLGQWAVGGSQT
jgi:small-conductance mechanosensitive channel